MNNKTGLVILVAVVALGGVWYLLANSTMGTEAPVAVTPTTTTTVTPTPVKTPPPVKTTTTVKATAPAKVLGVGPLASLFALKDTLMCTVTVMGATKLTGTMYVTDSQMRANFTNSTMINDGKYLYVWMNGTTKGTKLLASLGVAGSAMVSNGGFDPATDIAYSCNSWVKDAMVFMPPSSVLF